MNMFLEKLKKLSKNKFIVAITILVLAGWYLRYRSINHQESIQYAVTATERSALISSISGSGQVVVSDQINIKPKTSGSLEAIYVNKDQGIWVGQLIAVLDTEEAQRAVRDAQNDLDEARRNLYDAKNDYEDIEIDAVDLLETTYEDAYSVVSTTFFKLSDYMKDLKDVLGTDMSEREYVAGYSLLLGRDSLFIKRLIDDYEDANNLFNENFTFFGTVFQDDENVIIYELLNNTVDTTKSISKTLESARHLYDAITINSSYKNFDMASQIDQMKPKIESDIVSVYSQINSLQKIKETIDNTNKDTPKDIEDAQLAVKSAQDVVVKREEALSDAEEKLNECNIYAPFSGRISYINSDIKKGDIVSSGTTLVTLITEAKLVKISFNEIDAAKLKVNQKATVIFDALPDVSISGKVADIDVTGSVSQGIVSYGVKISLDIYNDQVKAGMSATADIIIDTRQDVLVVPNSAVKYQRNSYYVKLVEVEEDLRQQLLSSVSSVTLPQSPKIQIVETGLSNDTFTEIISGLEEGDIVVYSETNSNMDQTSSQSQNRGFQMRGSGMFR